MNGSSLAANGEPERGRPMRSMGGCALGIVSGRAFFANGFLKFVVSDIDIKQ